MALVYIDIVQLEPLQAFLDSVEDMLESYCSAVCMRSRQVTTNLTAETKLINETFLLNLGRIVDKRPVIV